MAAVSGKFDTLMGPASKFSGTITGKGSLRIEGEIDGEIDYDGDVIVGERAVVKAAISASNLTIAGQVEGNVKVSGRLELVSSGKLTGDMSAGTLVVSEGALFQGRAEMGSSQTKENPRGKSTKAAAAE